ncbi:hypothetical protein ACFLWC_01970 [Chloroflexota bacterium]
MASIEWDSYDKWNTALAKRFFNSETSNRPVYLRIDQAIINEVGESLGFSTEKSKLNFSLAILGSLFLSPRMGMLLDKHFYRLDEWIKQNRTGYPPFIALLAFFCMVAESMKKVGDIASHNFYTPLTQTLGFTITGENREYVRKGFYQAKIFWNELRYWLDSYDGSFGFPTASALDRRVHIGLPLSQVMLTESDLEHLSDFFSSYNLEPNQTISNSDMQRLLKDWVPHSNLSKVAKKLWSSKDNRNRVSEICRTELASWDGSSRDDNNLGSKQYKLLLTAIFSHQPRPRVQLDIAVRGSAAFQGGLYTLVPNSSKSAIAAFASCGNCINFIQHPQQKWIYPEENDRVSIPDLLSTSIRMNGIGDSSLSRRMRRMIILTEDPQYRIYIESERVGLGSKTVILIHESLVDRANLILSVIAKPGYRTLSNNECADIPRGWKAITDVQIMAISDTEDHEFGSLVPLAWTQIFLNGGLALPSRSTWHSQRPPEVQVVTFEGIEDRLSVEVYSDMNSDGSLRARDSEFKESTSINLAPFALENDNYTIELQKGDGDRKETIERVYFRLRSADTPRVISIHKEEKVAHNFTENSAWASISATAEGLGSNNNLVVGPSVLLNGQPIIKYEMEPGVFECPSELFPIYEVDIEVEDDSGPARNSKPQEEYVNGCLLSGAHYWLIEGTGPKINYNKKNLIGVCKYCGIVKYFPARPSSITHQAKWIAQPSVPHKSEAPQEISTIPITINQPVDYNLLFDALCYYGSGSWDQFLYISKQMDDSPWFALNTARQLSALGHIDLSLNKQTMRPEYWSVIPAMLIKISGTNIAILLGRRSDNLVESLQAATESKGGEIIVEDYPDAPHNIFVTGLSDTQLEELCTLVQDTLGVGISFNEYQVNSIIDLLEDIQAIHSELRDFICPAGVKAERFNPKSYQWQEVSTATLPGAYRFYQRPVQYAFVSNTGAKLGDNQLTKYLAAASEQAPLMAYDALSHTIHCRLGAQLPGLFERAAVLCSGKPPTISMNGFVTYSQIPIELAEKIWKQLSKKPE